MSGFWRVVLSSFVLASVPATSHTPQELGDNQVVFGADVSVVTVSVSVFDDDDSPIGGLEASDFRVRENGEDRRVVVAFPVTDAPLDVGLLLDLSTSMRDLDWEAAAESVRRNLVPDRDCVLLMGFSYGLGTSIWGQPDDPMFSTSIKITEVGGATALYDSTVAALHQLVGGSSAWTRIHGEGGEPLADTLDAMTVLAPQRLAGDCPRPPAATDAEGPVGRRAFLIVSSDGIDGFSHNFEISDVERASTAAEAPIFFVRLGGGQAITGAGARVGSPAAFSRAVDASGGLTVSAASGGYAEVFDLMRTYYVIGYEPGEQEALTGTQRYELKVEVVGASAKLRHPRYVYR